MPMAGPFSYRSGLNGARSFAAAIDPTIPP